MKRFTLQFTGLLIAVAASCIGMAAAAENSLAPPDKLVVHEWGTFTSLQDETGKQLGGINVDDEPVPPFVHELLRSYAIGPQHSLRNLNLSKGVPSRLPYVTLRLETPVIYFYPPKSHAGPLTVDVDVQFRGGWLTQFYPNAVADAPAPKNMAELDHLSLDRNAVGTLTWSRLQVGTKTPGPKTDEAVWITPRNVAAANVTTPDGESERYLFYRGVGHIDSPLAVVSDANRGTVTLQSRFEEVLPPGKTDTIHALWLVHIKADGSTAFHNLKPVEVSADPTKSAAIVTAGFDETDYSKGNLSKLQHEMHAALMHEGLFDEEATAMLQTWQKSYFASGGMRLFYVVPRSWTDHYLPLSISPDAKITRVMMARTELISPEQRQLLTRLSQAVVSDPNWQKAIPPSPAATRFFSGHSDFGNLGVAVPPDYQMYLDLGRFRNALLLHEQARHGTPSLEKFVANYELYPFKQAETPKQ